MSLELLRNDFLRFATLHSWYKHIPFDGKVFYFYLGKGQQIRHPIDPQVDDEEGDHFRFSTAPPTDVNKKYGSVIFGPFLRGQNYPGFHIIEMSYGKERLNEWVRSNYPDYANDYNNFDNKDYFRIQSCIAQKEQDKYWNHLVTAYYNYNESQ